MSYLVNTLVSNTIEESNIKPVVNGLQYLNHLKQLHIIQGMRLLLVKFLKNSN